MGQDTLDDDFDAGRRRMNSIRLVQFGHGGDPVEKERIERNVMFFGESRKDGVELGRVLPTQIRRAPSCRQATPQGPVPWLFQ